MCKHVDYTSSIITILVILSPLWACSQSISLPHLSHLLKEGGDQRLLQFSPVQNVTIGVRREGLQANLDTVTEYSGVFLKASLNGLQKNLIGIKVGDHERLARGLTRIGSLKVFILWGCKKNSQKSELGSKLYDFKEYLVNKGSK